MKQFVPITDEMLYRHDQPPGALVPYHCGVSCLHYLAAELLPPLITAAAGGENEAVSASPSTYRLA